MVVLTLSSCSKEEQAPAPPPTPTFTLNFSADTGGTVSTEGGTYNQGSKITVTATPDGQFLFKEWSDGSTQNPREITVTSNLTLKAIFIKKTYPLSVTIDGEGTVQEQIIIQGSTTETEYNAGTTVRLTATPNEGWEFSLWVVDGEVIAENPIEVVIEKGREATVFFKRTQFELNITIEGEGTVKEEVIVQPGQYDYETVVRLTAVPADGYVFSGWSGDVTSEENPIELEIKNVLNIKSKFIDGIELSFNITGRGKILLGNHEIVTDSIVHVEPGNYEVKAIPENNHEFIHFGWNNISLSENPKSFDINGDNSISVVFGPKPLGVFNYDTHTIYSYPLQINSNYTNEDDIWNSINSGMGFGLNGLNGNFNLILDAGNYQTLEGQVTYHLSKNKTTNQWSIINQYYPEPSFGNLRDIDFLTEDVFVFADHGQEYYDGKPWPYGYVWLGKNMRSESIQWKQVSNQKSFYHSVAGGDLDEDGDFDIISNHFGTYGDWTKESPHFNIHSWLQNSDGSFIENRNLFSQEAKSLSFEATSVEITDLNNDGINEIISSVSGFGLQVYFKKNNFFELDTVYTDGIFSKDTFSLSKGSPPGATTIESSDIDGDGDIDLIVIGEGYDFLQIWNNDGSGTLSAGQLLFEGYEVLSREFELIDIDQDGDLDITLNPILFWMTPEIAEKDESGVNGYIKISELIYFNQNGVFTKSPKTIKAHLRNLGGITKLKGSMDDGVFKFWFIQRANNNDSEEFSNGKYIIINELVPDFSKW
jgi:hypothetical protein